MDFLREAFSGKNPFILRVAFIAAIGGFLFGYDTGVIGGATLYIKKDLDVSQFETQALVGALLLGAVVGAMISGWTADRFSRKWTKVGSGTIYEIGALASAFAPNIVLLIAARALLGVAVGTASFVSPMYISEHAPKRIRGGVTTFNQLMVVSGIFVAYIATWALKGIGTDCWRWMLGLAVVPGLALAIGMLFMPHSPRWLMERGREGRGPGGARAHPRGGRGRGGARGDPRAHRAGGRLARGVRPRGAPDAHGGRLAGHLPAADRGQR